ncbi:MAG: phosphotransferase [Acidimicrobiia bacterium]
MDDAAGGRRGQRPQLSPSLFDALHDEYGIDVSGHVDLGGSSNLNLLITTGDARFVARVYRQHVTARRLDDIQVVRRALVTGGVPCSQLVTTRHDQPWTTVDDLLVEVEHFVEHDAEMDSRERLTAGLPLLGQIHTVLRGVTVGAEGRTPRFANHVEAEDIVDRTLDGTRRIRSWGPTSEELQLAESADELAHLLASAERDRGTALPRQLVHGDFWDNNVLFREGRVVLVTDFDFMGERVRIDDLALTLYFASLANGSDRLADLVDAYEQGLDRPLGREEREALPLALARQPLWSVGGWIATLDDEDTARRHAAGMNAPVAWARAIVDDLERWRETFS